eukprot:5390153-Prorocentrum_lima.AAC.1
MEHVECLQKTSSFLRKVIHDDVICRSSCLAFVLSFREQPIYLASCTTGTVVPYPKKRSSVAVPSRKSSHFL